MAGLLARRDDRQRLKYRRRLPASAGPWSLSAGATGMCFVLVAMADAHYDVRLAGSPDVNPALGGAVKTVCTGK